MAIAPPMLTADFDFHLPEDLIALRPVSPRDSARLMVVRDGRIEDRIVRDLADLLQPGDASSSTTPGSSRPASTACATATALTVPVEATLHQRTAPDRWTAFMKPGKRLKPDDRVMFGKTADGACLVGRLDARVVDKGEDGLITLAFDLAGPALDDAIREAGVMPLPPYIAAKRPEDDQDRIDYQTLFARHDGSVAAPTAGLHFTPELMAALAARGVSTHAVTLHVGAGTFLPVKADNVADHRMHAETGEVSPESAAALNAVRAAGGRIVCVGTTSLRLLESAADEDGVIRPYSDATAIFITPGYRFRAADVLMTNFHLPRSTLFMLVSAFAGTETMKAAYAHAVDTGYRFYSYGDGSLLFRA
ncbi:LOW QUALITY PROTEIN: S-adenosylmethionine:tRNA ribosyltransferase-isomerase [Brevundimonas abyssalis TAR-001]|uniref:S-adenosylmethionine:tRNA ribosyltransferase-isomerase n=1 Tax=Brevundimonas abyssalis TAR-001 TaxID=1391729 RepID=A0A8E0NBG9_9CAUL|nr:LOW QUALITY PROTEIN: S-adenosylmethionine:tRNA ribosyltransferase-isomerase [Brevundimonas abyssalis TAR-001]